MRSIIILKGLAKTEKLKWVNKEKLNNYFLDIDVIKKLYSYPDLIWSGNDTLRESHSSTVYNRFIEILLLKLAKGCLIVIDMNLENTSSVEILSFIHGYQIFYKNFSIPSDYIPEYKHYNLPYVREKKKSDIKKDIKIFLDTKYSEGVLINSYAEVKKFWKDYGTFNLKSKDSVIHISDLHSNSNLLSGVNVNNYNFCVFHGDYIDGLEKGGSRKIIEMIVSNEKNNFIFLEGNHEIRLRKYLGWVYLKSLKKSRPTINNLLYSSIHEDFIKNTADEFSDITSSKAKDWITRLNSKLLTHAILKKGKFSYICTHSGIRLLEQISPKHIGSVIYGNKNIDIYDKDFSKKYGSSNIISIHAHCKYYSGWNPIKYDNVINLDPENEEEIVYAESEKTGFEISCLEKLEKPKN